MLKFKYDEFILDFFVVFRLSELYARRKCNCIYTQFGKEISKIIFTFRNAGFIIQQVCCNYLVLQAY